MKRLSANKIGRSSEIAEWLSQFSTTHRPMAESMLLHLRFVSRDEYSDWFRTTVGGLGGEPSWALFAVRKLEKIDGQVTAYFDDDGNPVARPSQSLGSEDLVYSLISNIVRNDPSRFLDHPDLDRMKAKKVRHIVLIDDSIGSGERVAEFMNSMMRSKTLLSWWSYGLIRFTIASYARAKEGEQYIIRSMVGSNHAKRTYPKATKMCFRSERVYTDSDYSQRWGKRYLEILLLCDSVKKVDRMFRRGYGDVMASIIFYHSVPNNIPGMLHRGNRRWKPLFSRRSLPDWIIDLLEEDELNTDIAAWTKLSKPMIELLRLAKRGVRNKGVIAHRTGRDDDFVESLLSQAINMGMISEKGRITKAGMDAYYANTTQMKRITYDYSLYMPSSWCVGRETVQPSRCNKGLTSTSTDLADSLSVSGEVGEASLEETDAKAAPFSAEVHLPSMSNRENLGTDGPPDLKE